MQTFKLFQVISYILIIALVYPLNATTKITREKEIARETKIILTNQYISRLNNTTSETYFDMLVLQDNKIAIENVNNDLKKIRKQFTENGFVFDFPYQEMLYILYKAISACSNYKLMNSKDQCNESQNHIIIDSEICKYDILKDKCKSILQHLILFDVEYYIYRNNSFGMNLLTVTKDNINKSIENIINGINKHIGKYLVPNKSKSISILNEISNEILKQDTDKIKLFYKKYYSIMDNNIFHVPTINAVSKRFDCAFNFHDWFNIKSTETLAPYHDHKSLIEFYYTKKKK